MRCFAPRWLAVAALIVATAPMTRAETVVVDFDELVVPSTGFVNNSDPGFTSGGVFFNNNFTDFGFFTAWYGWSYSNVNDTTTPGFLNQYAAITGTDFSGTGNYAVAYSFAEDGRVAFLNLPVGFNPVSARITNTTYAFYSIRDGDQFATAFSDGDFFRLDIVGYDDLNATGNEIGTVEFFLADYRNGGSLIVNTWELVDLSSLAGARSLGIRFFSTDTGPFGINTPAYFAMDNFTLFRPLDDAIPEPSAILLTAIVVAAAGWRAAPRRQRPQA
ncbi:hypothetical protein Isop_2044 [Isosphaera pallida ATCC 43644]|uniref:PEP-CTERM protein-sorting domain-containing protein n=1 Tax=Isosphaera pallida (strain ATCC 43644 / DSM 9630 / IS1B) TaxID=575540 RepID=E8R3N9_ISOPI|nr:DUF4465 domain-containing protein [Isosphaera pallida]ADV62624.1 hypothetical protein Isop_2044 [Isosphaera pallida ATCC 43644]